MPYFLCVNCKMMFFVVKEDEARCVGSDPVLLPCIAAYCEPDQTHIRSNVWILAAVIFSVRVRITTLP